MEKNAAKLESIYRQIFETEIAMGNDIISAKRTQRDEDPFNSIDKILESLDSLDETGVYAA